MSCENNISQVVSSECCPVFNPDGTIQLVDASGNTATLGPNVGPTVINMTGPSADFGNLLIAGSDNLPYLALTSLPVGISADVGQLLTLGADNLPFLNVAALPVQGISSALGNRLTTGPDGLPFLSTDTIKQNETVTSLSFNTGTNQLTYNNEAGAVSTFDLSGLTRGEVSLDSGNLLQLGSDQQPFFSINQLNGLDFLKITSGAAASTVLNGPHSVLWGQRLHFFSTGSMVFTAIANAAGGPGVQGEVRLSNDAGNALSFGLDGGLFFNSALIPTTGISGDAGNLLRLGLDQLPVLTENDLPLGVSAQANNILINGSDRKPYLSAAAIAAGETTTTLVQVPTNSGIYQYTNEAGVVSNLSVLDGISADAGNILVLGADDRPYLSQTATVLQVSTGPDANTLTGGPVDLAWGDRLHFYSGGSISFGVSAGSALTQVDLRLSSDLGNLLAFGTDGGVLMSAAAINQAVTTAGIISADADNVLRTGSDNLALLQAVDLLSNTPGNLLTTDPTGRLVLAPTALPAMGVSRNANNSLTLGTDQLPFFQETNTNLTYGSGILTYTNENGQVQSFNIPAENFLSTAAFNAATNVLTMTLVDGTTVPVDLSQLVPVLPPGANFNQLHDPVTLALGESNLQLTGQSLSLNVGNLANALNAQPGSGTLHNPVTITPADSQILAISATQQLSINTAAIAQELNGGAPPPAGSTVHPALTLDPANINGLTLNPATQVLGFSPPATTPLHAPTTISATNNGGGALTISGQEISLNIAALQTAVGMPTIVSANPNNLVTAGTDGGAYLPATAIPAGHDPVTINPTRNGGGTLSIAGQQLSLAAPSAPGVIYAVPPTNGFVAGTNNVAEALNDLDGRVRGITAGGVAHNPVTISATAGNGLAINAAQVLSYTPPAATPLHRPVTISSAAANGLAIDGNQVLSYTPPAATPLHAPTTISATNNGGGALTIAGQEISLNIAALQTAVGNPTVVSANANNLISAGTDGGAFLPATAIPPSHNPVTISATAGQGLAISANQVLSLALAAPGVPYTVPTTNGFVAGTDNVGEALNDLDARIRGIAAGGVAHNPVSLGANTNGLTLNAATQVLEFTPPAATPLHAPVTISPTNGNGLSITGGQVLSYTPPAATPLHAPVTIANSGGGALTIAGQALSLSLPADSPMTGATAATAGAQGDVPAPAAGDQTRFLRGDGTWADAGAARATYCFELGQGGDHFVDSDILQQHAHVTPPPNVGTDLRLDAITYKVGGSVNLQIAYNGTNTTAGSILSFNNVSGVGQLLANPITGIGHVAVIRERVTSIASAGSNVVLTFYMSYIPA